MLYFIGHSGLKLSQSQALSQEVAAKTKNPAGGSP
jgi:hypothetical protein